MAKLVFGATLLVALVNVSFPVQAQSVVLSVCNAGKVDIDVLVAKTTPVVTTHIVPNTCAPLRLEFHRLNRFDRFPRGLAASFNPGPGRAQ